jgi:sugar phosphate isomerase/epimerase
VRELLEFNKVKLYIENNVISAQNYENYQGVNPLLLTGYNDYLELKDKIDFNLLLDIAHLKVSSNTLGLDFGDELKAMLAASSYIHISDNDGTKDSNNMLTRSEVYRFLEQDKSLLKDKDFTLEVYSGKEDIVESFQNLESLL